MKKTAVSLILTSILTGSLYAQTSSQEDILNNVLTQLLKEDVIKEKKSTIKKDLPIEKVAASTFKSMPIAENKPVLATPKLKDGRIVLSTQNFLDTDNKSNILLNEDYTTEDIHTGEREVNIEQNKGHMFLLNVPVQTEITANIDLILPPFRDKLIYHKGKLVSENPFNYSEEVTYCYLSIEESGLWRRFKSDVKKVLIIENNVSNKVIYASKIDERNQITVYETTFTTNNKHIKSLVCETSEKELPLTIKDLNEATGNLFRFKYTPMLDI